MAVFEIDQMYLDLQITDDRHDPKDDGHFFSLYEFHFSEEYEEIFNKKIKRRSWRDIPNKDVLITHDLGEDRLLPAFKDALTKNEPSYWEPWEPDVRVAFYPDMVFPFFESGPEILWQSESRKKKIEEWETRKQQNNILDDDPFTIIILIDSINLFSGPYSDNGIAFIYAETRKVMMDFYNKLEKEFREF